MKGLLKRNYRLIIIFFVVIIIGCTTFLQKSATENNRVTYDKLNFEKNVIGLTYWSDQVLALINENDRVGVYIGNQKGSNVENFQQVENFPNLDRRNKNYEGVEVNEKGQFLYLYGTKIAEGTNFFDIYDLNSKEILSENIIEGSSEISNIKYKDGYVEGMIYAKNHSKERVAEVILNTKDFNSHLDLLEIDLPSSKAYVSWVDIDPAFTHILYIIEEDGNGKTYLHDLTTNKTNMLSDFSDTKRVLFKDEKLVGFYKRGESLTFETEEAQYETKNDRNQLISFPVFDTVIKDGIVVDPETETIKFGYDVGIMNDKVERISTEELTGKREINAYNKIVSPGFIDMLSFNPNLTAAKFKIGDGVTTNLSMHGCTVDYDAFFKQYENNPTLVNYGGSLYAIRLRYEVGLGNHGTPSPEQIDQMVKRAREEIKKGALAVSFSPEYYPGTSPEEIKAIMKVAKEYGIVTHFHGRHSSLTGEYTSIDSVKEVLGYARELDAPVHFMHLHSTGGTGVMDEALRLIEEARAEGYEVTYDIYPYDSWATNISFERLSGDWQSKFGITYSDIQVAGTTERLTEETFPIYRKKGGSVIVYAMDEEELIKAMKVDHSMIGSDSTMESEYNHPRGAGTFSRFIGRYIRDMDVLPFMKGLKKVTIHAASQLEDVAPSLKTRGRLQVGSHADITVFNYHTILDTGTPEKPASLSKGIDYVLVSGSVVKDELGIHVQNKHGQPIKGIFE